MLKKTIILIILLRFFWAWPAFAVTVEGLYVVDVLAPSQERAELVEGAKTGLLQVLVRASGRPDVGNNTIVRQALDQASDYYYQYSFSSTDKQLEVNGEPVVARMLTLHFEPNAINKLLREAGLPVWGSNRPAILVWIAVEENKRRRLLTSTDDDVIGASLAEHAKRRGLPLIFPVMDLEDEANISVQEVWGAFLGKIDSASERYKPDSILTARVNRVRPGLWSGNWSYKPKDRWLGLSKRNVRTDRFVGEIIDRMANELAVLYGRESSKIEVWLEVESIDSVEDYAHMSQYVESLAPIVEASIVEVSGPRALFRLVIEGNSDQLTKVIKLDRRMKLLTNTSTMGLSKEDTLHYGWVD